MAGRHVCFVDSIRTLGGAELWILDAAAGLRERGHRTTIVAQPGTPLLERAVAAGHRTAAVPIRFDAAPWTLVKLVRALRRDPVDVVLCNLTKDLKAAAPAARLAGVPAVLALRESDFPLKDKLYYRWYFGLASGVVANSEATRRTVLASVPWLAPERVHLLYKWVDCERFRPVAAAAATRAGAPAPVVGFLGQLIHRKGLDVLMAAWERLETGPWPAAAPPPPAPPELVVAGRGPLADRLARWRAGLRRPAAVRLAGWVERGEDLLPGLTVLALPSRQEGFGLVAAEAAACGVPVVATDASSLPELVRDGETGLLVPAGDPEALAAALAALLSDPGRAARLGAAGRRLVRERFDRPRGLDALEALLERILAAEATR